MALLHRCVRGLFRHRLLAPVAHVHRALPRLIPAPLPCARPRLSCINPPPFHHQRSRGHRGILLGYTAMPVTGVAVFQAASRSIVPSPRQLPSYNPARTLSFSPCSSKSQASHVPSRPRLRPIDILAVLMLTSTTLDRPMKELPSVAASAAATRYGLASVWA